MRGVGWGGEGRGGEEKKRGMGSEGLKETNTHICAVGQWAGGWLGVGKGTEVCCSKEASLVTSSGCAHAIPVHQSLAHPWPLHSSTTLPVRPPPIHPQPPLTPAHSPNVPFPS